MLTVFFSDIKDFTRITEDLEPEDLALLVNDYFSEMSKIALGYGATIDKFIGDAMLMFFGDPESRGEKEDALQCVRMAMAMQRRMAQLQRSWAGRGYAKPFHMRVGINTGVCNVGNFGSDQRMDYTIIGSAVNLAARLQQLGEPDGVLMAYKTWALVREEFAADEMAPLEAKGFAEKVRCFALRGILGPSDDGQRQVEVRRPGMRLDLDLDALVPEDRQAAIADLRAAIGRLYAQG